MYEGKGTFFLQEHGIGTTCHRSNFNPEPHRLQSDGIMTRELCTENICARVKNDVDYPGAHIFPSTEQIEDFVAEFLCGKSRLDHFRKRFNGKYSRKEGLFDWTVGFKDRIIFFLRMRFL